MLAVLLCTHRRILKQYSCEVETEVCKLEASLSRVYLEINTVEAVGLVPCEVLPHSIEVREGDREVVVVGGEVENTDHSAYRLPRLNDLCKL